MSGYVYFIQCGDEGPIKIGSSSNVQQRMRALRTACPYTLTLLFVMGPYPDAKESEFWWHKRYASVRLEGEWFLPTSTLLDNIENASSFEEFLRDQEQAA